jgi:hypothetical protein
VKLGRSLVEIGSCRFENGGSAFTRTALSLVGERRSGFFETTLEIVSVPTEFYDKALHRFEIMANGSWDIGFWILE